MALAAIGYANPSGKRAIWSNSRLSLFRKFLLSGSRRIDFTLTSMTPPTSTWEPIVAKDKDPPGPVNPAEPTPKKFVFPTSLFVPQAQVSRALDESKREVTPSLAVVSGASEAPKIPVVGGDQVTVRVSDQAPQPTFELDQAQPLDRASFPDGPQGRSNELPSTIANAKHLLDSYGITVRYNVIKKKLLITLPGHTGTSDNADNTAMTQIISLAILNGLAVGQIPSYVELLGDRNPFNPVAEWIKGKPWDGVDRLPEIFNTLTEREGFPAMLKRILVYKWLLSAVAAALKPSGFKGRGVLTFQGPQGIGKTSFLISLVPDAVLRESAVKVDHHLDVSNKDSILGAVTHWIVEIGELDSSFKKDVSRLKGFLTSDFDKVRRPYARTESEYPRRTVFFATVNEENFLVDTTGNSRWWTIPLTAINYQHGIDMQQVFAQLAVDLEQGAEWWLTPDEERLLDASNSEHRSISVIRERLMAVIDMDRKGEAGLPAKTSMELLKQLGFEYPKNGDAKEMTAILRELLGPSKKIHGSQKWRVPLRRDPRTGALVPNEPDDDDSEPDGKY